MQMCVAVLLEIYYRHLVLLKERPSLDKGQMIPEALLALYRTIAEFKILYLERIVVEIRWLDIEMVVRRHKKFTVNYPVLHAELHTIHHLVVLALILDRNLDLHNIVRQPVNRVASDNYTSDIPSVFTDGAKRHAQLNVVMLASCP